MPASSEKDKVDTWIPGIIGQPSEMLSFRFSGCSVPKTKKESN